jgi:phage terminase large subunit-like protein
MSAPAPAPPKKSKRPLPEKPKTKAQRWHFTAEHLADLAEDDPCRPFAEDVVANPGGHNRFVHLACRRHALDLRFSRDPAFPFIYDVRRALRPTLFAAQFKGLQGHGAGEPLAFLPWQRFCAAQIFGWRKREQPLKRRFRYALIKVPRKNGKTGFIAPLGLLQLSHPPPGANAKVYSLATKEEIAKIALKDDAMGLLRTNAEWAQQFRAYHKTIKHNASNSEWIPLGSDSDTLDGLRPELVNMDELHAWKDRRLWDVMNSACGAAFSPLMLQITTEGDDPCGLLKEQDDRVIAVLEAVERGTYRGLPEGSTADEGIYFGILWQPDKGDKWDELATWHKANPSLGTVKDITEMRSLMAGARSSLSARRDFLTKQLNIRQTTGPQRWLDIELWEGCVPPGVKIVSPPDAWTRLKGLRLRCGMDLASTTDTSSFCVIADDPDRPGHILAAWLYWLPDEDLPGRCARDHAPYDLWAKEGWLSLIPGPIVDVNQIERDIVAKLAELAPEGSSQADVGAFAYDPGWAQGAGQRLQDEHGLPMLQCPQRYSTMTAPLSELERWVIAKQLDHGGNPIAHANASVATVAKGAVGGILLAKSRSTGRIDGLAALAMAIAARQHELANGQQGGGLAVV